MHYAVRYDEETHQYVGEYIHTSSGYVWEERRFDTKKEADEWVRDQSWRANQLFH